ncbi:winged helix-turn-helix domain-containing protein [Tessaracoccus caeni]|uniref:winged helix-turn-helix domain-containing protein n=1 Tax=Tessaracoccus caeni TaxID=3031239 RepID=UPI0023DC3415|nr:crosslink repair DNA glycosylase YcaQ family protein [Tessaracoccus caeni]MDF1490333.1 crosslink repair DNA glycosylase YcaQ family protein [Tessaracoccus caeni]
MKLTQDAARRMALAAQGLHRPRIERPSSSRAVATGLRRLQLLQIDSVNVLSRAHYMPLFSRLGAYDRAQLDRLTWKAPRKAVEFWAHEASYIAPEHFTHLLALPRRWFFTPENDERLTAGGLGQRVIGLLHDDGPLTARQVADRLGHVPKSGAGTWWSWSQTKTVLEVLFGRGLIGVAGRNAQFERCYAPIEKVLPADVSTVANPDLDDAVDTLMMAGADAHGVGTVRCLADYFRLPIKTATQSAARLVAQGRLIEAEVSGWGTHLVHPDAARPRKAEGRALLSPFDSMVFERARLERMFGFYYRIGIYTPKEQRTHGYYVLPFLLRDRFVARVDLKLDRAAGKLLVKEAHAEPGAPDDTAHELAAELHLMATWMGADDVLIDHVGDLAPALSRAL